jgi:hypothetical protein
VGLVLGGADAGTSLEQFIPAGWESGECPGSYGPDSVLCGAADSGPFKVDHHIPTAWIRRPKKDCEATRELGRRDAERRGFTVESEVAGRCGSSSAPCVERIYRVRKPDAARGFEYVVCPAGGDALLISYGVSPGVAQAFHDAARRQVRFRAGD